MSEEHTETEPIFRALSLLESVIKSGERWSPQCAQAVMLARARVAVLKQEIVRLRDALDKSGR